MSTGVATGGGADARAPGRLIALLVVAVAFGVGLRGRLRP